LLKRVGHFSTRLTCLVQERKLLAIYVTSSTRQIRRGEFFPAASSRFASRLNGRHSNPYHTRPAHREERPICQQNNRTPRSPSLACISCSLPSPPLYPGNHRARAPEPASARNTQARSHVSKPAYTADPTLWHPGTSFLAREIVRIKLYGSVACVGPMLNRILLPSLPRSDTCHHHHAAARIAA
jgi:hypothetical protein